MSRPLLEFSDPLEAAHLVVTQGCREALSACPLHRGCFTSSLRIYQDASGIHYGCIAGCPESALSTWMHLQQTTHRK